LRKWNVRPEHFRIARLGGVPSLPGTSPERAQREGGPRWHVGGQTGTDRGKIAVALHDIEPATFERCALIRDWLDDHGVTKVTLLVIPARDLHPLGERSPEMVDWLIERGRAGDSIAQHGFQHLQSRRATGPRQALRGLNTGQQAEFLGLDAEETLRAVEAGRRVLKLAGIEPYGFVAPAYAYTPALRQTLSKRFRWWAGLLRFHRSQDSPDGQETQSDIAQKLLTPPISLASAGPLRRALAPRLLRAGALLSGETMRLDLHPADLQNTRHMLALERVLLRAASRREAVTYDELAAGAA
jgi:predicted deacetylase